MSTLRRYLIRGIDFLGGVAQNIGMSSKLSLRVEAFPGSSIQELIPECQRIADRLGVVVLCEMNTVDVMCRPGDDPDLTYGAWQEQMRKPGKYALAVAGGRP